MKKIIIITFLLISTISSVYAQQKSFLTYRDMKDFLFTSPGAFKFGLYGFENPAMTSYLHDQDLMFITSNQPNNKYDFKRFGVFTGNPYSGFGAFINSDSIGSVVDWRYNFSFGNRVFSMGLGYGFVGGDKSYYGRSNTLHFGMLIRPKEYLSLAYALTYGIEKGDNESVFDVAARPFQSVPITFFGDLSLYDHESMEDGAWSAGMLWELLDGLRISARYFKDKSFSMGLDISLGTSGIGSVSGFDDSQKYAYTSIALRSGALDRTVIDLLSSKKKFVKLDLNGSIKYNKFVLFDNSITLFDVLRQIEIAQNDKSVSGIVVNTSGMKANMAILWEIREKLQQFKKSGKEVVVFIDRMGIRGYHFASVANRIVMDQMGTLTMEGYAIGRSYYKRLLDKLGIGFEELRFFKYKSAVESFARNDMSEGEREQWQKIIDDFYAQTKEDITRNRKINESDFDSIVNGKIMYTPNEAKEKNLVDDFGRWVDVETYIEDKYHNVSGFIDADSYTYERLSGLAGMLMPPRNPIKPKPFDDRWSISNNNIAIIYALGSCDMDNGIKARTLSNYIKAAVEDKDIKAIVLRVDSPGGDAMASDYISEIIRKFKGRKPFIISQGAVAASGGYWLSMEGDTIVSTPMTLTGSIGVISAWIYDNGMKDTLGISTEIVKQGKYADLGMPFTLPIIPLGLPLRKLNNDERGQFKSSILQMYGEFTQKVATARKMKKDAVDSIAQGRVWSGRSAKNNGLVDVLGGLDKAISIAKKAADISEKDNVTYIQYPQAGLIDLGIFGQTVLGIETAKTVKKFDELLYRVKTSGVPMPVMSIDFYDYFLSTEE